MAGALRKVGAYVQNGIEKIQEKTWAEPLGKGLAIGAKIATGLETFVPGAGIVGGALAFGASLLNPEPTIEDLQEELKEIKGMLMDDAKSTAAARALQRQQADLEQRISNPAGEIRENFEEIKKEMKSLFKSIEQDNNLIADDLSRIKDIISQTYLLVADVRYRDGIEKVDAAYEVFIAESSTAQFDDFKQYAFELKTIATQNLAPKRIQEYLKIIYQNGGGFSMCNSVMDYIIVVLGKYLQIMVAYNIFKEDPDRVTAQFEQFNEHYANLLKAFEKVTQQVYKPGEKPMARVKPIQRTSKDKEKNKLQRNPEMHAFLEDLLLQKGITLADVLDMDKDEVEDIGIQMYKQRKLLLKAIQDHNETDNQHLTDMPDFANRRDLQNISDSEEDTEDDDDEASTSESETPVDESSRLGEYLGLFKAVVMGWDGSLIESTLLCPNGHQLIYLECKGQWTCDADQFCVGQYSPTEKSFHCMEMCDFDLCSPCEKKCKSTSAVKEVELRCRSNHSMVCHPATFHTRRSAWACDGESDCVSGIGDEYGPHERHDVWKCPEHQECDLDLCGNCVEAMKSKLV